MVELAPYHELTMVTWMSDQRPVDFNLCVLMQMAEHGDKTDNQLPERASQGFEVSLM